MNTAKKFLFLMIYLCGSCIISQGRILLGKNTISLTMNGLYYLNQNNVSQANNGPLNAKNTLCYSGSLDYILNFKRNIIVGVGIDIGAERHEIVIVQRLDDFDPQAKMTLAGARFEYSFVFENTYIAPKISIGYRYHYNPELNIVGKLSFRKMLFLNGGRAQSSFASVQYPLDTDSHSFRVADINSFTYFFGEERSDRRFHKYFPWNNSFNNIELYIGVEKPVKNFWIKSFSMGMSIRRTVFSIEYPSFTDYYVSRWKQANIEEANYYQRNLAIGLSIGVNF